MKQIRKILSIILLTTLWWTCAFVPGIADEQDDANTQYKIKIAFIYNFLKFVDWPGDKSPKRTNSATVCITGDRQFSNFFRELQGTHKQDLAITINDTVSPKDIPSCNVLYIGHNAEENAASLLAYTKGHPVLSISEAKDFADNGGIIEIMRVGKNVGLFSKDKINLRINLREAEADNLNIDARLLQIASGGVIK